MKTSLKIIFILLFVLFGVQLSYCIEANAALNDVDKQAIWGKSIVKNGGFENGKASWTASGGTFAIATSGSNLLTGRASATWDSDSASQTLSYASVAIPNGLKGKNGVAACKIMTPSGSATHTLDVTDGTNVLSSDDVTSSTTPTYVFVNFIFPSSGSVVTRLSSVASDEPSITVDDCWLGDASEINLTNISQAKFIGSAYFAGTASCGGWTVTSTSAAALASDTDCPGPTVEHNPGPGTIQTTDSDLPKVTVNNLPPGYYEVVFNVPGIQSSASNIPFFAINDGTTTSQTISGSPGITGVPKTVIGYFNYTNAGNRSFELYAGSSSGSVTVSNELPSRQLSFFLKRYPLSSEQAFTTDQSDYGWTAYTPTFTGLGTVSTTSVFHKRTGDTLFVRGYTTCGTPTGVAAEIGLPGSLTIDTTKISGSTYDILGTAFGPISGTGTGIPASTRGPYNIAVNTSDTSNVYIADVVDSDSGIFDAILGNEVCASGQRMPFQFQVPISGWQNTNRAPQLVNSVVNSSTGVTATEVAKLNCDSAAVITSQHGSWVASIGNVSAGACAVTISSGIFSATPYCTATPATTGGFSTGLELNVDATSSTAVSVDCENDASAECTAFDFILNCVGAK